MMHTRYRRIRATMLIAAVLADRSFATAADPAPATTAPATTAPAGPHWQLGPYIQGDTAEVLDLVNGPLERLTARRANLIRERDRAQSALDAKSAAAATGLRQSSPAFARAQADLDQANATLAEARAGGDPAARIMAAERVRAAQAAVQRQLDAATAGDPAVAGDRAAVTDAQRQASALDGPIAKATAARASLLDGLRDSLAVPGPPAVGGRGFLNRLRNVHVVDAQSFTADYVAVEKLGEAKGVQTADGVKAYQVRGHRVKVLVTGTDTARLRGRSTLDLDRTYQVAEVRTQGHEPEMVMVPVPGQPFDYLFAHLDDLHAPGR